MPPPLPAPSYPQEIIPLLKSEQVTQMKEIQAGHWDQLLGILIRRE